MNTYVEIRYTLKTHWLSINHYTIVNVQFGGEGVKLWITTSRKQFIHLLVFLAMNLPARFCPMDALRYKRYVVDPEQLLLSGIDVYFVRQKKNVVVVSSPFTGHQVL